MIESCAGCQVEAEGVRALVVASGVKDKALIERTVAKARCAAHRPSPADGAREGGERDAG